MADESDRVFAGSVPQLYDRFLVPLIFEPYAWDLAERVARLDLSSLLEIAAGTGVVTRALAAHLPDAVAIIATDLNQPMIDHAQSVGTMNAAGAPRPVTWQAADAQQLPFEAEVFDVVACQFGVMFFPDRTGAFAEVARVLRPGGTLIFSVWDRLETNEFAAAVHGAVAGFFPDDPPSFLARTPYGYHDEATILAELTAGGLTGVEITAVEARSLAASNDIPALAFCQGTPLRNEIASRDPALLEAVTASAAAAIAQRFGSADIEGAIRALVVTARRPAG